MKDLFESFLFTVNIIGKFIIFIGVLVVVGPIFYYAFIGLKYIVKLFGQFAIPVSGLILVIIGLIFVKISDRIWRSKL